MPVFRVSIVCPVQITYYVQADGYDEARDVDAPLHGLAFSTPDGGLATERGVYLDLMEDGADYDNIDVQLADNVAPDLIRNMEE